MKQLTVLLCGVLIVGVIGAAKGENRCSHRIIIVVQTPKKITVSTNLTSAKSRLQVQAVDCVGGISAGRIPLIVSGHDFVTSISNLAGMCMLKYSVDAAADKSTGIKVHTVFYTITDAD